MIPHHDFTPHGYLDNPYHSWKLNPSGVLRSLAPLGMGWHVPNLGTYVRNQFQYTAHLMIGIKIHDLVLITPEDFHRHGCQIHSHLHTRNRFEYTCLLPDHGLTLTARYFLVHEHALGCVLSITSTAPQPVPVTCYLTHIHTHNPYTSRLWEHGLYTIKGPETGTMMLGIASEGDVFTHGIRSAHGTLLNFDESVVVTTLQEVSSWAKGLPVDHPGITQRNEANGWQYRAVTLPCHITLEGNVSQRLNVVLARGVSQNQSFQHWEDGIEEIARAEADHAIDDEAFWQRTPQLVGDWPDYWRRGMVYDFETLRMTIRPSAGIIHHAWDGMQIQAPRTVLAEAAMDILFLSYADPKLAADVILGHFESSPHPHLPCMREDGSYNMVADDGQICGTAPEWGFPIWCIDQLFRRTGDLNWLRRLYPKVSAYLRWWLEHRRDSEGWLVYACSWESGQDVSSRFGPQQTGGTIIQHVRPVDLQASMVQTAGILARWATLLSFEHAESSESAYWSAIADEFTVKTRQMWQNGWFRDFDSVTGEWSTQQDSMHLAPVFCGASGWGHVEQLRAALAQPPAHSSGWAPLSWPPVVMTLVGAAAAARMPLEAAELAYTFIDASYRSIDSREPDEHGGLPGVTREYRRVITQTEDGNLEYANAGIEGYGWGALSIHLVLRYLLGLYEEEVGQIIVAPQFPAALRQIGKSYRAVPVQWGNYVLDVECTIQDKEEYSLKFVCNAAEGYRFREGSGTAMTIAWQAKWGEERKLQLPHLVETLNDQGL